jgi:hypothetical protein
VNNELAEALVVTAEVCGTDLSEGAATMISTELATYDRAQVLGALSKCRRELKGRLTMAAILERLDDGRPGVEEAWSMMPRDESQSVVWTDEMAAAFGVVGPMIADDAIAARMAFKECYSKFVSEARDARRSVNWTATLGHSASGRDGVLALAVSKGRLTLHHAQMLGYDTSIENIDMLCLVDGKVSLDHELVERMKVPQ